MDEVLAIPLVILHPATSPCPFFFLSSFAFLLASLPACIDKGVLVLAVKKTIVGQWSIDEYLHLHWANIQHGPPGRAFSEPVITTVYSIVFPISKFLT